MEIQDLVRRHDDSHSIHNRFDIKAAGLEVVGEILSTQSILIGNPNAEHKDLVAMIKRRIEGFITSTKYEMIAYNVTADLVEAAKKITPGKKSPTITSLDDGGKAISALVHKNDLSKIMDELYELGATDILSMHLSNSRM